MGKWQGVIAATGLVGSLAALIYQRAQLERLSEGYLVGLIFLCACSFVALFPAFADGIKLVRRVAKDAAAERRRKKRMSSGY